MAAQHQPGTPPLRPETEAAIARAFPAGVPTRAEREVCRRTVANLFGLRSGVAESGPGAGLARDARMEKAWRAQRLAGIFSVAPEVVGRGQRGI